jgi:hypothetical protein
MTSPPRTEHIVKLALGPKEAKDLDFKDWELVLAEIITGNSLGVDRMDYLLRDSHHADVGYGKFDHFRLLETLRNVVPPPVSKSSLVQSELPIAAAEPEEKSTEPALGLLFSGLHSAEALLLARYFMFAQVYCHHVRIAYNRHLKDFLAAWLPNNVLPNEYEMHLALTDNEVNTAIRIAAADSSRPGHVAARRIVQRDHFKFLRQFTSDEVTRDPLLPSRVAKQLQDTLGYPFILYKRGPYSFELSEDLSAMGAFRFIEDEIAHPAYGPRLKPKSDVAKMLRKDFGELTENLKGAMDYVVDKLAGYGVVTLERLATALYFTKQKRIEDEQERATKIHKVKPHIPQARALEAVRAVEEILAEWKQVQNSANRKAEGETPLAG